MTEETIKLTRYSRGAGCGCKIAPATLQELLKTDLPEQYTNRLLVGNNTADDAAVYDMGNGKALIATTDFFMPIVDDAFDFGRIAAANAISDVYAMGGQPLMALAILGWPVDKLPASLAARVLDGARTVCAQAGIPLAGGHSIDSAEPFFGLNVNGMCDTTHVKRNSTAQKGDILLLTKPLGTGVLSTAMKREVLKDEHYETLVASMTRLNIAGSQISMNDGVHAMTDVTGFGLAGHLCEMADGANLTASINYNSLPLLAGVKEYMAQRMIPDATYRNWNSYGSKIHFESGIDVMEAFNLLPDPQTNGGLLLAVSPQSVATIQQLLTGIDATAYITPVGIMAERGTYSIIVGA